VRPDELIHAPPRILEELLGEVFNAQGYEVELTAHTRDGGIDLIAIRKQWPAENFRLLVESKRYRADMPIGVGVVRGCAFLLEEHRADRAIIAPTRVSLGTRRSKRPMRRCGECRWRSSGPFGNGFASITTGCWFTEVAWGVGMGEA
jgi:hypothetical protein